MCPGNCGTSEGDEKMPLSNDIQSRISEMSLNILQQVIAEMKNSQDPFSMQLDETTDCAQCSHLLVFVRYVHNSSIKEQFLWGIRPFVRNSVWGIPLSRVCPCSCLPDRHFFPSEWPQYFNPMAKQDHTGRRIESEVFPREVASLDENSPEQQRCQLCTAGRNPVMPRDRKGCANWIERWHFDPP